MTNPLINPAAVTRLGTAPKPKTGPPPDVEPYADERNQIKDVGVILNNKFRNKVFTEKTMFEFVQACQEMYADIGWLVGVDWYQAKVPATGETTTIPNVIIMGRVNPLESIDHDRVQHDVVTGKMDGQAGWIRPDGRKTEDPAKKLIY